MCIVKYERGDYMKILKKALNAILFSALTTVAIIIGFIGLGLICTMFTNILQAILFAIFVLLCWAYYMDL